jgi:hypothetical protein
MNVQTSEEMVAALLYLVPPTTVPWDELLATTAHVEPLTQRERCELLLRTVNGERLPASLWSRLVGANESTPEIETPVFKGALPALRAALTRVVKNPATAIKDVGTNSAEIVNDAVLVLPRVSVVGRRWVASERLVARSRGHALAYALNLFLDPDKPFGRYLRQCQWSECGRFAIVRPRKTRGQPPTHYCDSTHRRKGELARMRARVADLRRKRR